MTDEVETHALAGIHLSIARGEYVAISGPSGCGKSTLMAILGLLDTPSEGDYWLDGRPVASLTPSERARIRNCRVGFIFQSFNNFVLYSNTRDKLEMPRINHTYLYSCEVTLIQKKNKPHKPSKNLSLPGLLPKSFDSGL